MSEVPVSFAAALCLWMSCPDRSLYLRLRCTSQAALQCLDFSPLRRGALLYFPKCLCDSRSRRV
jgi:hypothetical protein